MLTFGIIIGIVAISLTMFMAILLTDDDVNGSLFLMFVCISLFSLSGLLIYSAGEKEGQIQVTTTGKSDYHLVKHEDSTSTWELIKKDDK